MIVKIKKEKKEINDRGEAEKEVGEDLVKSEEINNKY